MDDRSGEGLNSQEETLRASQKRRRVAALIGILSRHRGPDAAELVPLRRRLDELRVAAIET